MLKESVLGLHWKDWYWRWNSNTLATWWEELTHLKDPDAGKDWGQEEKGTTEDETVGWHHRLNGHEFEWTPGVSDGQGGLACCRPWGHKELDTTEWLNWTVTYRFLFNLCTKTLIKLFLFEGCTGYQPVDSGSIPCLWSLWLSWAMTPRRSWTPTLCWVCQWEALVETGVLEERYFSPFSLYWEACLAAAATPVY